MREVDFDLLRKRIAVASRRAFDKVKAAHAGERIYSFAIHTTDDTAGVNPSASSAEAYERVFRKREADSEWRQWLEDKGIAFESSMLSDFRWSPYDWEYECEGVDEFDAVNELINFSRGGFYDRDDEFGLVRYRGRVFASMVLGLLDLESERYFGTGSDREKVTVFCSVATSYSTVWLENDSARRLNPAPVYQAFRKERIELIKDDSCDPDGGTDTQFGFYLEHLRQGYRSEWAASV
jgi:hypothetical protein